MSPQLGIDAAQRQQLGMGALLNDLTLIHLNAKGDSLRGRREVNFAGASAPLVLNVLLDHLQRCTAARASKVGT